jgi:hypothetical protein
MDTFTSRRALIGCAGLAAIGAAIPLAASALLANSAIERHWRDRCAAYREFEADPDVLDDEERANAFWDRIEATEVAILNSADVSPRAAELRLWVAWAHTDHGAQLDNLVAQGDVASLLKVRDHLDWHEKLIFAAILNLRGEG